MYLANLFAYDWEMTKSPAGATQWIPTDGQAAGTVPDAHVAGKSHAPIMFTTDLALKTDPAYREISQRFLENPAEFEDAFARAWFKLTHRDMGPRARYVGTDVPAEVLMWQDPIPDVDHELISDEDVADLKAAILDSGASVGQLAGTAWASAASYRHSDMRGGANGARVRLSPMKDWPVNNPAELDSVLAELSAIQTDFNDKQRGDKRVSLADVIVLGGAAAIEKAAADAGYTVQVPFVPGRMDAAQEMTDADSFAHLELRADGFRNFYDADRNYLSPVKAMIDRANLLDLNPAQMTALVGGLRVLGVNSGGSDMGVFTDRTGVLSTDFFSNLLDMSTVWTPSSDYEGQYVGSDRASGTRKWTASPVDLMFGSSSELRAIAEVYAANDGGEKFIEDFVSAWSKVMTNDRFDLEAVSSPRSDMAAR